MTSRCHVCHKCGQKKEGQEVKKKKKKLNQKANMMSLLPATNSSKVTG